MTKIENVLQLPSSKCLLAAVLFLSAAAASLLPVGSTSVSFTEPLDASRTRRSLRILPALLPWQRPEEVLLESGARFTSPYLAAGVNPASGGKSCAASEPRLRSHHRQQAAFNADTPHLHPALFTSSTPGSCVQSERPQLIIQAAHYQAASQQEGCSVCSVMTRDGIHSV